ncbi:unnamed protein product, partial [Mycena citricolor]
GTSEAVALAGNSSAGSSGTNLRFLTFGGRGSRASTEAVVRAAGVWMSETFSITASSSSSSGCTFLRLGAFFSAPGSESGSAVRFLDFFGVLPLLATSLSEDFALPFPLFVVRLAGLVGSST